MVNAATNLEIFQNAASDADISIIEGMMGLFDGISNLMCSKSSKCVFDRPVGGWPSREAGNLQAMNLESETERLGKP